jgi:hypothetical protein
LCAPAVRPSRAPMLYAEAVCPSCVPKPCAQAVLRMNKWLLTEEFFARRGADRGLLMGERGRTMEGGTSA